jgi:3-phytase
MKRFLKHSGDQTIDTTDSEVFWIDDHSNLVDRIAEAQAQPDRPAQQSPTAGVTAAPISAFPNDLSSGEITETSGVRGSSRGQIFDWAVAPTTAFPDGVSSGDVAQSSAVAGSSQGPSFDPAGAPTAAFPDWVSSGDVTQTSAVVWTRAIEPGRVVFQIATDPSFVHIVGTERAVVTDPLIPVKVEFDHLKPGQHYFYRAIDASGDTIDGSFATANELGTHHGFNFAIVADQRGDLAPFPAIKNAVTANLDLVVKLGDTIYADIPPPAATTLDEFRLAHDKVYSSHYGFDFLAQLQARTPILSVIDDHEVRDNFAGGAPPASDPRFAGQPGDFINETPLYQNGLQAFKEYNAIEERTYSGTGEDRFDGAPDLYRYNIYGSDAAIIMVDARSFRDTELPDPANPLNPADVGKFLSASFDPSRTMLGDVQLARLEQDLLDARDNGVTWKFVMLGEAIQNFGPIGPGDRYEGYAAERDALLKFIDDNHIENVVFVSSDTHWTSVNNLTYQDALGGPQIASSAFEVNTLAAAATPLATLLPAAAFQLGLINAQQLALYNSLPNAPDSDSIPNDKDDFVKSLLNGFMTKLGYDPIGLESSGPINATLLKGDYFVGHDYGWTDFGIDGATGKLLVTTWGSPAYTAEELAAHPTDIIARDPVVVSQFDVTPTSQSIIGTAKSDQLQGTPGADVILGAPGNDVLYGLSGDDYLDGGKGNDTVFGGDGADQLFGREGNDSLSGQDGDDRIDGGPGNDVLDGGAGNDVLTGGAGNDIIIGGPGNDKFLFGNDFGHDTVLDFQAVGAEHDSLTFSKSVFADWTALAGAISDSPDGAVITVDAHNAITLVGVTAAEVMVEVIVHAIASFDGIGAADGLTTGALSADKSQQTFLTTPHA